MVGDDGDRMGGSLDILFPFFQCKDHSEEFTIIDVVVSFGRNKCLGEKGTRVGITIKIVLKENSSSSKEGSIGHDGKRASNIWDAKDRSRGKGSVKGVESPLLEWGPIPRLVFSSEKVEGRDNVREIWDKFGIEICES